MIQCDSGHLNGDLIACARYRVYDERVNALNKNKIQNRDGVTHVLFIINLPHQVSSSSFVGFQGDPWISSHIDDLRPTSSGTIEPLHAITTNISELFIGEYIHDITPLLDVTHERIPRLLSQSVSEESLLGEGTTQEMPMHDADVGSEGSESDNDTGEHQMQPELQVEHSFPDASIIEQLPEFPGQPSVPFESTVVGPHHQLVFQEQGDDELPTDLVTAQNNLTNKMKVINDVEEDKMEFPSANIPQGSLAVHNISTESDVAAYQENPVHLESADSDRHQLSPRTCEPVEDDPAVLHSIDEIVTPSQAVLFVEPEVPNTTDMDTEDQEIHPTPLVIQNTAKQQPPSGQCRRLYGCIQAAASRLEDSTKDRSTQRVTCLTKLIQKYPDNLSKQLLGYSFYLECFTNFVVQSTDPQSFHGILVMHIYRLLQEREFGKPDLANWVLDEALNASNLEVGGTFRNVLARKVDEVVIPIFAKIIASIDRNYNLDLINPKAGDSPLVRFWLAMFRDPKVQQLQYSEMAQQGKVAGIGGRRLDQDFKCKLPFFWLVKDAVDSQWDSAKNQAGMSLCYID